MRTYTAVFRRDDEGVWLVELAEEPRVHTYGKTLAKAREHIRDATELWTEGTDFELVEDVRLPKRLKATVERARRERERAAAVQGVAIGATRDAARALVEQGHLTMRDAAAVLGVSHQRVQQLLAEAG